jgi:hypothetical protein
MNSLRPLILITHRAVVRVVRDIFTPKNFVQ